jgi:O-antigen ligase
MPHRQNFRRIANSRRERLLASAFLAVLAGAVLSFGGAEPASGFAAEAILLLLAACALWLRSPEWPHFPWPGVASLFAVLALERYEVRPAEYPAHAELLLVAAAASAFFIATRVSETAGIRRLLCGGLLALCLFEALYGLVQYLTGWQQIGTYEKIAYTMMATGTYINPNHFAGLLEMALPLTFAWSLWEFERVAAAKLRDRSRDSRWPVLAAMLSGEVAPVFALFLFATLVLAAALLFSRSRMGIFSAFIGLGAVATGWIALRRKSRSATSGFAAAGLMLLILAGVLAAGAWIGFGPVLTRFRDTESDLPSRLTLWKDTIELIRAHPVWGTGPGSFEDAYTLVQAADLEKRMDHAHSDYLEFAEEWGIPAAALLFALVGGVLARGALEFWRARPSEECMFLLGCCGSALGLLVHSVADFNLHIPANAFLFATLLGLVWTLSENLASRRERQS